MLFNSYVGIGILTGGMYEMMEGVYRFGGGLHGIWGLYRRWEHEMEGKGSDG